ncbi:N-acetyltransferase family protein [Rhizobium sp. PAMB 3174]
MQGTIRPVHHGDYAPLISVWHRAWQEAYADLVPPGILAFRTPDHFSQWLAEALGEEFFSVAVAGGTVLGFVSTRNDEICRLYVDQRARGSGAAQALLAYGEDELASAGCKIAKVYCLAGNTRAERFYQRQGWSLRQTVEEPLWLPEGVEGSFKALSHMYEKPLA